jgi:hypothetical protein
MHHQRYSIQKNELTNHFCLELDLKTHGFSDFIHCLVSQEQTKLKIKNYNRQKIKPKQIKIHMSTNKSHKDQLQTTEQPTWAHTHINPWSQ